MLLLTSEQRTNTLHSSHSTCECRSAVAVVVWDLCDYAIISAELYDLCDYITCDYTYNISLMELDCTT